MNFDFTKIIWGSNWRDQNGNDQTYITELTSTTSPDTTPPTLTEITPVSSPTTDTTPNYTFHSTEAGTIQYSGDCSSATDTAVAGDNTVTFNTLSSGAHSNCDINVTDASSNQSSALHVTSFTITLSTVSSPTASPNGGTYSSAQNVTLSTATEGATIYYTTDGSIPSSSSSVYFAPMSISSNTTLKAIASKTGMNDSSITTEEYTITRRSSSGGGGSSSKDTDGPHEVSIEINNGETKTNSGKVTVLLTAKDRSKKIYMQISEKETFSDNVWFVYTNTFTWIFSEGNGLRTLYARFKDGKGNISNTVHDTITLYEAGKPAYVKPVETLQRTQYIFTRDLGMGAQGVDVIQLQKILRREGFFTYPTNSGYYGSITVEAVRLFQRKYGIKETGFVDIATRNRLKTLEKAKKEDTLTLTDLIKLLITFGIIPKEKAEIAYTVLTQL